MAVANPQTNTHQKVCPSLVKNCETEFEGSNEEMVPLRLAPAVVGPPPTTSTYSRDWLIKTQAIPCTVRTQRRNAMAMPFTSRPIVAVSSTICTIAFFFSLHQKRVALCGANPPQGKNKIRDRRAEKRQRKGASDSGVNKT